MWGLAIKPHRCCRLLCVEHVEEHSKPVLYLVSLQQLCVLEWYAAAVAQRGRQLDRHSISEGCCCMPHSQPLLASLPCVLQVFEFLSTDLKKFMDRTGRGPLNPLPPMLVKV